MRYASLSHWNLKNPPEQECRALAEACGISVFLAKLLWNRDLRTAPEILDFLHGDSLHAESCLLMPDIEKAVERLKRAIQAKEKVLVFGDYDVDGITSTVLLYDYLSGAGVPAHYYIPTRSGEGYGLNTDVIRRYADKGVTLLITVDSGVTAFEEVKFADSCGMEVLITDHHRCRKTLPEALAVVNPMREDSRYPDPTLAGVGVVFKLLCALHASLHTLSAKEATDVIAARYIEFVAIGTVADVMPLTGENRQFVRRGLAMLKETQNIGLQALMQEIHPAASATRSVRYNSGTIGFLIAPRINAAGRVGSAMRAVELFLTQDRQRACALATELCEDNKRRQVAELLIYQEALSAIEQDGSERDGLFLMEENQRWHQGVVGIVASRLCEQFHRPCILFSYPDGPDGPAKGSGRSIRGLNLVEALSSCEALLLKYGGHELAAGVTIRRENIQKLREALNAYAEAHVKADDLLPARDIDLPLRPDEITLENATDILRMEPFGMKNLKPLFLVDCARIDAMYPIGDGKHVKFTMQIGEKSFHVVCFNRTIDQINALRGECVSFLCTLDINNYQDKNEVQLCIKDLRPAQALRDECKAQLALYEAHREGTQPMPPPPSRKEFEMVFRQLKGACKAPQVDLFFFARKIAFPLSKLLLTLDIFEEAGLLRRSRNSMLFSHIALLPQKSVKASLTDTPTHRAMTGERQ